MARPLLTPFLVRIPLFPSVPGCGGHLSRPVRHYCVIPKRGWLCITFMKHEIDLFLRQLVKPHQVEV